MLKECNAEKDGKEDNFRLQETWDMVYDHRGSVISYDRSDIGRPACSYDPKAYYLRLDVAFHVIISHLAIQLIPNLICVRRGAQLK